MNAKQYPKKLAGLRVLRVTPCVLLCWICAVNDALAFPPQITTQPTNQTVQLGNNATFAVGATTSAGLLTYQWFFQASKIAGATNNTYTRTNAQSIHAGNYYVGVTNADGGLLSSNATLAVSTFTVTNASNSGVGSLRQAILDANAAAGTDTITFNIAGTGPHIISLTSALPDITGPVTIDGTSEPDYANNGNRPVVVIDGEGLTGSGLTMTFTADNCTIKGLLIRDFNGNGIQINATSDNNIIVGNFIGQFDSTGADAGASEALTGHGIFVGGDGAKIGGTSASDANNIFATYKGITLAGTAATNNSFLGNSIYGNSSLGIDLADDGVTANDAGDGDTGANRLQNFPVLTTARTDGASHLILTGTLSSTASSYYRVEFFASGMADGTGYGEGQRYLGFTNVATSGSGNVNFTATISGVVAPGEYISATATKCNSTFTTFTDTSEFAQSITAQSEYDVSTTVSGPTNVFATTNFTYTITVTNPGIFTSSNIVVSDSLPAGINVVSVSGGGIVVGGGPGQVVFDRASSNNVSGVTNWTHVTTNGVNRLMLVGISIEGSGTVSNITYGGMNLTKVKSAANIGISCELWQLPNPPSGTNSIIITLGGTPDMFVAGAATFSGVDQATPLSATNATLFLSSTTFNTITSATNEIVFDNLVYDKTGNLTPGAGQTELWYISDSGNSGAASTKPGTNSVTMSWNIPAGLWADIAASVKAAPLIGVVNWTIPTLASGVTTNFTVTVTAPLSGELLNIVSSTSAIDLNRSNNDGSAAGAKVVTTVTPIADVVIIQSGLTSIAPLTSYTYTVMVSNQGPCAASSVVVSDTLAPTLTYISSSGGGSYLAGVVTWPALPSLAKGATANFTVTVRSPISGMLTNTASSTSTIVDFNPANNNGSAVAAQVVTAVSPLQIANTSYGASVQTLNWSHTVSPGSSRILIVGVSIDVTNATVTSATFAGFPTLTLIGQTNGAQTKVLTYRMLNPQVGTFPVSISLSTSAGIVGGAVSFNGVNQSTPIAAFAGNAGSVTNASVTVASALGGVVIDAFAPKSPQFATNPGTAQSIEWNLSGPNYSGAGSSSYGATTVTPTWSLNNPTNWAMAAVALNSATVLADVTLTANGPASVMATSNVNYSITVTNFGSATATNVVVSYVLPAGATFVSASSGGTHNAGVITWPTMSNFVNGARTNYTLTLKAPTIGTLTNIVYCTAFTADPDPSNNNGTGAGNHVITTVTPLADVATTVAGPASVFAARDFNYSVSITNAGPSPAGDVVVSDTLPAGVTFVSASDGGTYNGGFVTWSLPSLTSGAAASFSVTATAPASGSVTNTVASTSTTTDLFPSNNDGSAAGARVVTAIYPIPTVTGQRLLSGNFQMELNTIPGATCFIEVSTNLVDWILLATTNSGAGHIIFADQDTTNYAIRFYRSKQSP